MNATIRNSDREAFARRVRHEIKRNGLTYDEVARRMRQYLPADTRLSPVSVWSYANGRSAPRKPSYLQALCKVIGVDAAELLMHPGKGEQERRESAGAGAKKLEVVDLDGARAFLHIQQDVPWTVALEVLRLLKEDAQEDQGGTRDGFAPPDTAHHDNGGPLGNGAPYRVTEDEGRRQH